MKKHRPPARPVMLLAGEDGTGKCEACGITTPQHLKLRPGASWGHSCEGAKRKRGKFGAVPTNGYASKREARYAEELHKRKAAGEILDWLEQVPIKLTGDIVYRCDFMLMCRDGSVRFVEVKGFETNEWKLKLRLLEADRPEIFARLEIVR